MYIFTPRDAKFHHICYVYCRWKSYLFTIFFERVDIDHIWICIYLHRSISRKDNAWFFQKQAGQVFSDCVSRVFFFDRVFGKKSRRLITWCLAVVAPCCRSWIVIPSNVRNLRVEAESFFFMGIWGVGNLLRPPRQPPPPTNKELFKSISLGILRFPWFLDFLGKEWGGISFGRFVEVHSNAPRLRSVVWPKRSSRRLKL